MQKQIKLRKLFLTIFILIYLIACNNTLNKVKGKTYMNREFQSAAIFKGKIAYIMAEGVEVGEVELIAKRKNKLVYAKKDFYGYIYIFIVEKDILYFTVLIKGQIAAIGGIDNIETTDCIPLKLEKD